MKTMRFLQAVLAELVSLIVDDTLSFLGAVVALAGTWVLAHQLHIGRAVDGFGLLAVVWIALLTSMHREARRRGRAAPRAPERD